MAGKKSEEQVEKPSLESGVEHLSEIWHKQVEIVQNMTNSVNKDTYRHKDTEVWKSWVSDDLPSCFLILKGNETRNQIK